MIWGWFFTFLAGILNGLYALLPAWDMHLGRPDGSDPDSFDNGAIGRALYLLAPWDRFLPIHDFFIPCAVALGLVAVGIGLYKLGVLVVGLF